MALTDDQKKKLDEARASIAELEKLEKEGEKPTEKQAKEGAKAATEVVAAAIAEPSKDQRREGAVTLASEETAQTMIKVGRQLIELLEGTEVTMANGKVKRFGMLKRKES
jgi:hypothetical protein